MNNLPERIQDKIMPEPMSGCWLWIGAMSDKGYGYIQMKQPHRGAFRAHRIIYEKMVGEIPAGKQLDHICRTRSCVNPAHLEVVTGKENTLRGEGPTAINKLKTHCHRGHEFTLENTYLKYGHLRCCRLCGRIKAKIRRKKLKPTVTL